MGIATKDEGGQDGWGATVRDDGTVRFRLWAPAERDIELVLGARALPMSEVSGGWFEVETDAASPGDAYFFRLSDGLEIADPASRGQADGVDGRSIVIDHGAYPWQVHDWTGRPWEETVLYELHVGTFTPEGTFLSAIERLPHLRELGVTAIEIMPVAHFAGRRGWGYDGVLHYAPHRAYGTPDDLKALVDAAHGHGLMVFLDVVYNHFGPIGNVLPRIAPGFFRTGRSTPWGAAVAFEEPAVRRYFIDNALQWIRDYRFDGLRFDATEQIEDESPHHILLDMAQTLRASVPGRPLHLVVEDQFSRRNLLGRKNGEVRYYTAGWNDELHHALHVIATGEAKGHYAAFARDTHAILRKATAEGFAMADPDKDGFGPAPGISLPPHVNVSFLQNHDQVGNRAFGDRLATLADSALLDVMTALLMLMPQVPLLFMGEEYGERRPFHFFADFEGEIAHATRRGRKAEAENFGGMPAGKTADDLPDPLAEETFRRSKLDWSRADTPDGRRQMAYIRELAALRRRHIAPLLASGHTVEPHVLPAEDHVLAIDWRFDGALLQVRANLAFQEKPCPPVTGELIHASTAAGQAGTDDILLPGPSILVALDRKVA